MPVTRRPISDRHAGDTRYHELKKRQAVEELALAVGLTTAEFARIGK